MPRARRGHSAAPVSLFAFQDVMTCVMAIMLMLTLLLALEQTSASSATVARPASAPELEARLRLIRETLDSLAQEAASPRTDPIQARFAKRVQLDALYRRIEEVDEKVKQDFEGLRARSTDPKAKDDVESLLKLQARAGMLRGELDTARLSKRLTYLAGQNSTHIPVILELAGNQWRFAPSHVSDTAITLAQPVISDRIAAAAALLGNTPPSTHYVLVVVKPSGFPHFDVCVERLKRLGYSRLGVEAIPEDWTTMIGDGATPGGGR